jgi:ribosomal protein S18 acetylase RimI-like enzyme
MAQDMDAIKIRRAVPEDVPSAADLIVRTKRLNNEFDPLFAVVPTAKEHAETYASESLKSNKPLLLVATTGKKVVGVLRAEVRERLFYTPSMDGHITDFYILPEFRRKALGNEILARASAELRKMGAEMVTAEVPTQNEIAVKFYTKRGFRSLVQMFAGAHQ